MSDNQPIYDNKINHYMPWSNNYKIKNKESAVNLSNNIRKYNILLKIRIIKFNT